MVELMPILSVLPGMEKGVPVPRMESAEGEFPMMNPGDINGSFINIDPVPELVDLVRFCPWGDGVTAALRLE